MKTNYFKSALFAFLIINTAFSQVGIGTTNPASTLDVNGAVSVRESALALPLANGVNNNFSLLISPSTTAYSFYRITAPTLAFSLAGLVPVTTSDGQMVTLENTTAQNFTIVHDAATSALANRIYCPGGVDLVLSGQYATVTLTYNKTQSRWIVVGSVESPYGKNIRSVVGTSNTNTTSTTFTDMADMTITFTPKHNIVYVNFSASGDMQNADFPQGSANFRIYNVTTNAAVAGTTALSTDNDGYGDFITSAWNASFTMYPVSVTPGVSTTLKIQWMTAGLFTGTLRNRVVGAPDIAHRNMTILD